jgi:hypothetical protein
VRLALGALDLEDGEVSVVDQTVKPFYRGRVTALGLHARGLQYPANTFDEFAFACRAPGNAPVSLRGKRDKRGVQLEGNAERIPLSQFNPYVTQAAGYSIASGAASLGSKVRLAAESYDSETRLTFNDFDLAGAEGDSLFSQRFGMPLTLALGLMRDIHGIIALTVPVSGDRGGTRVDLGAIIGEALARAIVNALVSPLKLLGAVVMDGNKVSAFTPEPIAFAPGRPEVADDAWWRIEQLATVLGSYPALRFELRGSAGSADVRALQEAAVLTDLQAEKSVLGSLRDLPSRGARNDIRDFLAARAAGKSVELPANRQETLEEWVAERKVTDGDLRALASARAERLRALLTTDYGVGPDRVTVGEAAAGREAEPPAVAVSLAKGG